MALNSFRFFCTPTAPRPALEPLRPCLFTACSFPGNKAISSWSWSLPSIYYHWLLRLIFVNILRSVGTVRDQNWSVGLVGSVRDFRGNKIFSSGMLRAFYWQLLKFRNYLFGSSWPLKMGPISRSETSLPIYIA